MSLIQSAVAWLGLFAVYLHSAPGAFYFEDSPELMATASMLGNTHPPGYPLLMLLGRLAFLLPAGSPALRFNLMGAAFGAGAAVALGGLAAALVRRAVPGRLAALAGFFAAGAWGLADTAWWEAAIGDKYSLYYLLFISLVWASVAAWDAPRESLGRRAAALGALAGLGFGHHLYTLFALPALALPFVRLWREGDRPLRATMVALFLALLPLTVRPLYPPIRSAAGVMLDWGRPRNAQGLEAYLSARLYHRAFASASVGEERSALAKRVRLGARLLREELPPPFLLASAVGAVVLARAVPVVALAVGCCMLADASFAFNFFQEVVRWYCPLYALLAALSAVGLAWLSGWFRRGALVFAAVAAAGAGWQFARGAERNALSGFYSASDMARNISRSLPPGSLYLGSGDFDLFPLWAARFLADERTDVDAVGLGSFADRNLSGMGGQEIVLARLGIAGTGDRALLALLGSRKRPLMVATADYDPKLWEAMPFLKVNRCRGLASLLLLDRWDPAGSYAETRRVMRACTLRGLNYAKRGAVHDLSRVRDEVARGALLHYPGAMTGVGTQLYRWGLAEEASWAFGRGRRMMVALAGENDALSLPAIVAGPAARARAERAALAAGFRDLAEVFEERGVVSLARTLRSNASSLSQ